MTTNGSVQAVVGLTGIEVDSGRTRVCREHYVRFDLPPSVTVDDVAVMQRDFQILSELAAQYPEDMAELHNAVLADDLGRARELAEKVGMTEEQIAARGGGKVGIVIGIVAVLALGALVLGHSGSTTTPRPVGPGDPGDAGTDGPSDAGADG